MPTTVVRRLRLRFVKTNRACVDSRMGAIAGIRGQATPSETMSRRYRRHTTPVSGGKGQALQALLASRACKDSVTLTALEIQCQATDDLRGIPCPRVGREKIHVVEDDTISILQHADMLSNIEQTLTLGCKASGASGVYLPDMSQLSASWFSHRQTLRLCALWLDERRGFQRYEEHQNIGAASNTTS